MHSFDAYPIQRFQEFFCNMKSVNRLSEKLTKSIVQKDFKMLRFKCIRLCPWLYDLDLSGSPDVTGGVIITLAGHV